MTGSETSRPTLGVTLYSFTDEWVSGAYTLGELLDRVGREEIGPAVEIVGFSSIRGFPDVSPEFVREFRDGLERNGLFASSLAVNIDTALRRDRYLTTDEKVDYLVPQIEAAHTLGFPVARIQIGAEPEVLERVAPLAERLGVHLGMEVHAPDSAQSDRIRRVHEFYERLDSPALGFIPDFSSTMHDITPGLLRSFVEQGLPEDVVPDLQRIWGGDAPVGERLTEFRELAASRDVPDAVVGTASFAFTMNGHADPAGWAEFGSRIHHVHAKFYGIDERGEEPSIDYRDNIAALASIGFAGTISSEWEGHSFTLESELDTFNLVRRQQQLLARSIEETYA